MAIGLNSVSRLPASSTQLTLRAKTEDVLNLAHAINSRLASIRYSITGESEAATPKDNLVVDASRCLSALLYDLGREVAVIGSQLDSLENAL